METRPGERQGDPSAVREITRSAVAIHGQRAPAGDGLGATFTATQVLFRDVLVNDRVLNVAILDRGAGNPPENAAVDAIAILQIPSANRLGSPRIASIRRVESNLAVAVDGAPNLPSSLAGLMDLTLEESADLGRWSAAEAEPYVFGGRVIFEFPPQGDFRFYRVAARRIDR